MSIPNIPLITRLVLQPITSEMMIHPNIPMIPPNEWAEFKIPTPSPSDPLPKYFEMRITLGPKKNAIPTPTRNLRSTIWYNSELNPERREDTDNNIVPKNIINFASYFADSIPAGI